MVECYRGLRDINQIPKSGYFWLHFIKVREIYLGIAANNATSSINL